MRVRFLPGGGCSDRLGWTAATFPASPQAPSSCFACWRLSRFDLRLPEPKPRLCEGEPERPNQAAAARLRWSQRPGHVASVFYWRFAACVRSRAGRGQEAQCVLSGDSLCAVNEIRSISVL